MRTKVDLRSFFISEILYTYISNMSSTFKFVFFLWRRLQSIFAVHLGLIGFLQGSWPWDKVWPISCLLQAFEFLITAKFFNDVIKFLKIQISLNFNVLLSSKHNSNVPLICVIICTFSWTTSIIQFSWPHFASRTLGFS